MTITNEVREEYIRLKARADKIEAGMNDQSNNPNKNISRIPGDKEAIYVIRARMNELTDYADVQTCEYCSKPIFDGDKRVPTLEGKLLCGECSPDLSDSIKQYKDVLAEDGDGWGYYNFSGREDMAARLAEMEAELAATGDRSIAHV